jgi:hypothetical protein
MIRRQVAQRLGKSLATVRRIEGVLLHPIQDAHGVHRFDHEQVETLAQGIESGRITLWQALQRTPKVKSEGDFELDQRDEEPARSELESQVGVLREELEDERQRHRREIEALHAQHERDRAQRDAERREFEAQLAEFMAVVDKLTG